MKKKVFTMLALMLTIVGGAWAQSTPEPGTLVPTGNTNEWTLTMPADNMLLMVNYYGEYTLDSIPLDWQVKVNDVAKTVTPYTEGNTTLGHLTITESDSVTLIPDGNPRRVKSVTLEEPLQSINVSGHKIYYLPGESWEQAIMNHSENTGWYIEGSRVFFDDAGILGYDDYPYNDVGKGDEIDPNRPCSLGA